MKTQRDIVFKCIKRLGKNRVPQVLTKKQLDEVAVAVSNELLSGVVPNFTVPEDKLKMYVPGLINNWLRKDERLQNIRIVEKSSSESPSAKDLLCRKLRGGKHTLWHAFHPTDVSPGTKVIGAGNTADNAIKDYQAQWRRRFGGKK